MSNMEEKLADAMSGTDEPMEESHPVATGSLILLIYPLGLVAVIIAALVINALLN